MTIICIKDRKLAWDSQVTSSGAFRWGAINDKVVSIKHQGKTLYAGGCGNLQHIQSFIKRLRDMDDDDFSEWIEDPKHNTDRSSTLFLYDPEPDILFEFQDKGLPVWLNMKGKSYAIGTGCEYAYGVMDSGKSAYEGVKMVIERFDGCGYPIHQARWKKK